MSFFEVETWVPKPGHKVDHDQMIKKWFLFVKNNKEELFPEWLSARYYREVERGSGAAPCRYVMMFEYTSHKDFLTYKKRRQNWEGPYAEYKKVDPYQFFDLNTVTENYWVPEESDMWLDFTH